VFSFEVAAIQKHTMCDDIISLAIPLFEFLYYLEDDCFSGIGGVVGCCHWLLVSTGDSSSVCNGD
jgi:hypothetical protein